MPKSRTEFFIEKRETIIIRRSPALDRFWCEDCHLEVSVLAPVEAAFLMGRDVDAIYRMMECRDLHFSYPAPGSPAICLRSMGLGDVMEMRPSRKELSSGDGAPEICQPL